MSKMEKEIENEESNHPIRNINLSILCPED